MIKLYLAQLTKGKIVLWCYLIWYLITVYFYFDPAINIWLNSLGISMVIGIGLVFSVNKSPATHTDYWQMMRLFMMPFCVSSFSSLIKGHHFILIIPPQPYQQITLLTACAIFIGCVAVIKKRAQ